MPFRLPIPDLHRPPSSPRRRSALALVALVAAAALLLAGMAPARADTIPVKSAELRIEEGDVLLNAEFEFSLNPTLEEALEKGIPLYFALDFELTRGRWYWLDEKVAQTSLVYRVSYNALTRQYRVASGLLTQTFNSLEEVERFIGRITSRPVASADALTKGAKYEAAVRLRLDVNQLPKPFQINALASREWTLASDWHRWTFTSTYERRRAVPRREFRPSRGSERSERGGRSLNALPGKRGLRWLLLVSASLAAIAVFLLATATANTSLFAQGYNALLVANGILVGLLMLVVGWQLWQLRRNLKAGIFGSRLAVRLVLLFALVAGLPGALVYAVSAQFIGRSIESWFDVRVDRALDSGLTLADSSLKYLLNDTTNKATQLAVALSDAQGNLSTALNRAAEQASVFEATLFTPTGGVLAVAGTGGSRATPEPPPPEALRLARMQQPYKKIEQTGEGGLALRVVVPVNTDDANNPLKLLQVIEPVPRTLAQEAERVQAGVRDYRELTLLRTSLKQLYQLTLALTLLLALTSALGLAVVLSERFAAPLGLLAEGTRAVAQGDFTRRQPVVSRDELGVLTESFNTMTAQLAEAQGKAEDSRRATETTRAYLESILGNLSSGVLAFDERHRLRTVNPSAAVILQQPLAELIGMALPDWGKRLPAMAPFAELVAEGFRGSRDGQWQKEAELGVASLSRTLLMRGTRLPGTPVAGGYVVVFDDVSELVQAQRDAAWAEVARRLAHEIKNPLTPIQLSAERLAVKLAGKLEGLDQETLKRGTQTIVSQVGAMKHMVDDFAIYARQPRPGQLQQVDLQALLLDVLGLYDNLRPHVALSLADAPIIVQGEPTRLRQVFHNLLSNAVDAQADVAEPHFAIALSVNNGEAALTFADGGPGFAQDVLAHAFEPYVTTKAKGTGLGLAIVKKIIDEHGGRVVLDNVQPHGARVTLYFPALPAVKPAAAAA